MIAVWIVGSGLILVAQLAAQVQSANAKRGNYPQTLPDPAAWAELAAARGLAFDPLPSHPRLTGTVAGRAVTIECAWRRAEAEIGPLARGRLLSNETPTRSVFWTVPLGWETSGTVVTVPLPRALPDVLPETASAALQALAEVPVRHEVVGKDLRLISPGFVAAPVAGAMLDAALTVVEAVAALRHEDEVDTLPLTACARRVNADGVRAILGTKCRFELVIDAVDGGVLRGRSTGTSLTVALAGAATDGLAVGDRIAAHGTISGWHPTEDRVDVAALTVLPLDADGLPRLPSGA